MKEVRANPSVEAYQRAVEPVSTATGPEHTVSPASGARVRGSVKLTISPEAKALAANAQPPADAEKVNALKEAVSNGTFRVDSEQVARAILSGSRDG